MGGGGPPDGASYSKTVGAVYIFNLIVGAGALSLPNAFAQAGFISGSLLLLVLAFFSYVTSTFMVEAMSLANALHKRHLMIRQAGLGDDASEARAEPGTDSMLHPGEDTGDTGALLTHSAPVVNDVPTSGSAQLFKISDRGCAEMAAMAGRFFTPLGEKLFYLTIIVYLYGDLCIYAAAVPVSLQNVVCPEGSSSTDKSQGLHAECTALKWAGVTVGGSYYVFLVLFTVTLGPFAYLGVSKTKYLQMFTTTMRWLTFTLLIVLCAAGIAGMGGGVSDFPVFGSSIENREPSRLPHKFRAADLGGTTFMFGASVYSFMCQHSLPSLVSPISDQSKTGNMLSAVFAVVCLFYLLLVYTAMFRFEADVLENRNNKGVYTLVWQQFPSRFVAVFVQAFPVFVLSTNFPIISITLRNNLATLGEKLLGSGQSPLLQRFLYPTLAIGPPIVVAFFNNDVGTLISITGSYAGTGIQYVIPAMVLLRARRAARETLGVLQLRSNKNVTPFGQGNGMIIAVLCWAGVCLVLVTWNHIKSIPAVSRHLDGSDDECNVYAPMLLQRSGVHNLVTPAPRYNCSEYGPWRGP